MKGQGQTCGAVGEPEAGRMVCELPAGHDGYHRQGRVQWLGYFPKDAPAAPASSGTMQEQSFDLCESPPRKAASSGAGTPELYAAARAFVNGEGSGNNYTRLVLAVEAYEREAPAAPRETASPEEWICEEHPWLPWEHDGCKGAGCLKSAAVPLLRSKIRFLRQELRERDSLHGLTARALLEYAASRETAQPMESVREPMEPPASHAAIIEIVDDWERVNACPHYGEDGGLCVACKRQVIALLRARDAGTE